MAHRQFSPKLKKVSMNKTIPPYSPDLAMYDFFIFSTEKRAEKKLLVSVENIPAHVTELIRITPAEEFQSTFQVVQNRLLKCIDVGRQYIKEF